MILPQDCELLLWAARKFNPYIIDVTGDQRWYHLRMYGVDIDRYGLQQDGMAKMHAEIKMGPDNIVLAWSQRWLLSLNTIENILTDEDKQNASAIITIINAEYKDKLLKTGLWLKGKRH